MSVCLLVFQPACLPVACRYMQTHALQKVHFLVRIALRACNYAYLPYLRAITQHTPAIGHSGRNLIEQRMSWSSQAVAILGISGLCCAIAQNELLIQGEDLQSALMNTLKVSTLGVPIKWYMLSRCFLALWLSRMLCLDI